MYYLLNSPYNLVSLELFNNSGIYHNNKNENFYKISSNKVLAKIKY